MSSTHALRTATTKHNTTPGNQPVDSTTGPQQQRDPGN
jgi:hypothetical protein